MVTGFYQDDSLMWGPQMGTLLSRCISSNEYIFKRLSCDDENTHRLSTDSATVEMASRWTWNCPEIDCSLPDLRMSGETSWGWL